MSVIECDGLTKYYQRGRVVALDHLNLQVEAGDILGFLGPNGAGKTTATKLLVGLIRPTSGTARVAGEKVSLESRGLKQQIGYLSQSPHYYSWMTGRELLSFVGQLFGYGAQERRGRVKAVLERVNLSEAADRRLGGYSGGMLQRLGIAQALLNEPSILFLDEPCASLDPIGRREVLDLIGSFRQQKTVILSSHILSDIERVCNHVAILKDGRLLRMEAVNRLRQEVSPSTLTFAFQSASDAIRFAHAIEQGSRCRIVSLEHDQITIAADQLETARTQLLAIVSSQQLALRCFSTGEATLEDVFLKIVGIPRETI